MEGSSCILQYLKVRLYKKILVNKTLAETQSFAISYFSVKTAFAVPEKIVKEFKFYFIMNSS